MAEVDVLEARLESHLQDKTGHDGVQDLDVRTYALERHLVQIKYTLFGVAAALIFVGKSGPELLGALFKTIGL